MQSVQNSSLCIFWPPRSTYIIIYRMYITLHIHTRLPSYLMHLFGQDTFQVTACVTYFGAHLHPHHTHMVHTHSYTHTHTHTHTRMYVRILCSYFHQPLTTTKLSLLWLISNIFSSLLSLQSNGWVLDMGPDGLLPGYVLAKTMKVWIFSVKHSKDFSFDRANLI